MKEIYLDQRINGDWLRDLYTNTVYYVYPPLPEGKYIENGLYWDRGYWECYICDVFVGKFTHKEDAERMKKRFRYLDRDNIMTSIKFFIAPKDDYSIHYRAVKQLLKGVKKNYFISDINT